MAADPVGAQTQPSDVGILLRLQLWYTSRLDSKPRKFDPMHENQQVVAVLSSCCAGLERAMYHQNAPLGPFTVYVV